MIGNAHFDRLVESTPCVTDPAKVDWTGVAEVLQLKAIKPAAVEAVTWCEHSSTNLDVGFSTPTFAMLHAAGLLCSVGKRKMLGGTVKFDEIRFNQVREVAPIDVLPGPGDHFGEYGITFVGPGSVVLGSLRWKYQVHRFRDSSSEAIKLASERDRVFAVVDRLMNPSAQGSVSAPAAGKKVAPLGSRPTSGTPKAASGASGETEKLKGQQIPSTDQVTSYLTRKGLKYTVDQDGVVRFKFAEKSSRPLTEMTYGVTNRVIWFLGFVSRRFQTDDMADLLSICNGWNAEKRWPKSYVRTANDDSSELEVRVQYAFPSTSNLPQVSVDSFVSAMNSGALMFWDQLFMDWSQK
jgi:hypothetical protein